MNYPWRPHQIQGNNSNICPTCSISHFPFCPPNPQPYTYPGSNIQPDRGPINQGRPVYNNHHEPYHDPGHWNRNPNPNVAPHYSYNNSVNDDRSSKRLRVDGRAYPVSSYLGGNDPNLRQCFDGGYPLERPGFDRNAVGGEPRITMDVGNHGVHHRKEDELGYNLNRSELDKGRSRLGNEYQSHGQYSQMATPQNRRNFSYEGFRNGNEGESYGYRPPLNYGSNFENVQGNGVAIHHDNRSDMLRPDQNTNTPSPIPMGGYGYHSPHDIGGVRPVIDSRPPVVDGYHGHSNQNVPIRPPFEPSHMSKQSGYGYGNPGSEYMGQLKPPVGFEFQPPLPPSPPPPPPLPLPMEPPPVHWLPEHKSSSSPRKESPMLFPAHGGSSAAVHYSHAPTHEREKPNYPSGGTFQGDTQSTLASFGQYHRVSQPLPSKNNFIDKPKTVDAAHLFKQPHRTSRPDHFVIILRGLPGSGKSYFAKMLRDLELEHGGNAPRIHSMDDYFMTEVEKTEDNDASKPLSRGKKSVTKTVLEFCYEPEMEEVYRSSMLKAFKKTLDEGVYAFVIVDDRNLRVADFTHFWATAKGCAARNVHGFTQDEVGKMAAQWEETPSLYLQLDVKSLLLGDDLKEGNIEEVDMDMEDEELGTSLSDCDERQAEKTSLTGNSRPDVSPKDERNSDAEVGDQTEEVKELGRSKWSENLDDDVDERSETLKGKANVLSGLVGTYGKEGKSVHWGDQGGRSGFSIGAASKAKVASLVIGPGPGYNMKSNPLQEEDGMSGKSGKKTHTAFKARLQAERDSFRAVFDRRRHRISGVGVLTQDE